jgi:hypothetical protein
MVYGNTVVVACVETGLVTLKHTMNHSDKKEACKMCHRFVANTDSTQSSGRLGAFEIAI